MDISLTCRSCGDLFKDIFIVLTDNTSISFTMWSVNIYGQRGASSPPVFYEIHECESKADKDSACNGKYCCSAE